MTNDFNDMLDQPEGQDGQEMDETAVRSLLGGLLGGLMGGGNSGASSGFGSSPQAGGMGDLGSLLGGLMGGGAPSGGQMPTNTGGMGGLLDSLMGGGAPSGGQVPTNTGTSSGGGSIFDSLMGGGSSPAQPQAPSNNADPGGLFGGGLMGGMLGGVLGSGMINLPFADNLAQMLGVPKQTANLILMSVIGLITSKMSNNRAQGRAEGVNLNSLVDPDYLRETGVASHLSAQMGVNEEEAIASMQKAMGLVANQFGGAGNASQKPGSNESTSKPQADDSGPDFMDLLK